MGKKVMNERNMNEIKWKKRKKTDMLIRIWRKFYVKMEKFLQERI